MRQLLFKCVAIGAAFFMPALAQAAEGFATANVNMRAGPSTDFPAITVIPDGRTVEIHGCLSDTPWCDVSFAGNRGWVSGHYVQATYNNRRVRVEPDYYRSLGIPSVVFSIGTYWNSHYRNRSFYHDRDKWVRKQQDHVQQQPKVRPQENNKTPSAVMPTRPDKNQPAASKTRPATDNKRPTAEKVSPNKERKQPTAANNRPDAGNKKPVNNKNHAAPAHNQPKAEQNKNPGHKSGVKHPQECRPGDQNCQQ